MRRGRRLSARVSAVLLVVLLLQVWPTVSPAVAAVDPAPTRPSPGANPTPAALTDKLLRARVTLPDVQSGPRLQQLGVTVLARATNAAIVVATGQQLMRLAQLGYRPTDVVDVGDVVAHQEQVRPDVASAVKDARVRSTGARSAASPGDAGAAPFAATDQAAVNALGADDQHALAAAAGPDADGDGLTDTEEGWWCTDPNNARAASSQRTARRWRACSST